MSELLSESDSSEKYLTFLIGSQEYGIRAMQVREILGWVKSTPVPRTNIYVKGIFDLRGKIFPVIDLRGLMGIQEKEPDDQTCVIVVEIEGQQSALLMGIVVDTVVEVLDVNESLLGSVSTENDPNSRFILGIAKIKNSVKTFLDLQGMLSSPDLIFSC